MVNVNFRSTYLDEKGGIAVHQRFGLGVLCNSDGEEVPLDDNGWAGPLSTNGDYFFQSTCNADLVCSLTLSVRAESELTLQSIYLAPSPLHDTLQLISVTRDLLTWRQRVLGALLQP